jgi:hypothetical protein
MTILPTALPRPLAPALSRSVTGRLGEFFLVGGLTPLLFPLSWLLRRHLDIDSAEFAVGFVMFHAAFVINDPHFAVTYLLFYKDAKARAFGDRFTLAQRVRYLLAGFAIPLLLGIWAITGLTTRSAVTLGYLIQLMFLLVGWHYVKQGFGVLIVLAARRGVRFTPRERLAILAHGYAGWAYAWASPFDPGHEVEEKGVVYMTLAEPHRLEGVTRGVFLATVIPLVFLLVQKYRREGRLPILTPLTALLCSIWPWSVYSSIDPLVRYMVPALHSVQYLYVVWLLKGNEAREREGPPWFERSVGARLGGLGLSALLLGWLLFHIGPSLLDGALAPRGKLALGPLGPTPYFAALYAFVNIHHYCMDAVLWRRENPEMRYLQMNATAAEREQVGG